MLVRAAKDEAEVTRALDLRDRVFCGEQGVAPEAERDGRDPEALHVVALEKDGLVGTCRLLLDGDVARLGRMAVEPSLRGRGIGAAVLSEAERLSRASGARVLRLHAQAAAESLYTRGGFRAYGERFVEEGIDHVAMEKQLA